MMNDSLFDQIQASAEYLNLELSAQEMAELSIKSELHDNEVKAVAGVLNYLHDKKRTQIVTTLLRMSRLPLKEPKTFTGFDFTLLHGKQADTLKELPSLKALYAHRNLALIGPPGVGKTHLAMAYARSCCEKGMKSYFLINLAHIVSTTSGAILNASSRITVENFRYWLEVKGKLSFEKS